MTESPNTPASTTSSRMDLLYADSPLEPPPSIYGSGIYRSNSNESTSTVDSSWDVVEDLPVRWATDFVPLAAPGSRLQNCSVHSYALWRGENQRSRGGAFLAIIVKSNILLYETPKGERAFRYVKVNRPKLNLIQTVLFKVRIGILHTTTSTESVFRTTVCTRSYISQYIGCLSQTITTSSST